MYNGVPVIGIPFFLDQLQNVEIFVSKGIGEKLSFSDIDKHLYKTIEKIISNDT